jgi:hypothetical protein
MTMGPRTQISPSSPGPAADPSVRSIRTSVPGAGLPTLPGLACPTGDVAMMAAVSVDA